MTALIGLALLVPARPRHLDPYSPPRGLIWPLFIMVTLVNSLSRTALGVAVVLLLFLAVRARRELRVPALLVSVAGAGLAVAVAILAYPPIISRFTEGDNAEVGGVSVNTSGRSDLWKITYDAAMRSPIWGNGPGNSKLVVQEFFSVPGTDHPHNDYLRIFNDLGLVGVALFWGGMLFLLLRLWRRARRLDEARHWIAVMAVLSVMLVGITDNIIVYQFIMVPVGVLVGISLRPEPGSVPMAMWQWAPSRQLTTAQSEPSA